MRDTVRGGGWPFWVRLRGVGEGIPNFVVADAGGKEPGRFLSAGAGHIVPGFLGV